MFARCAPVEKHSQVFVCVITPNGGPLTREGVEELQRDLLALTKRERRRA